MDGRTDSSRKGGGCGAGLELHICMHRMVNWAEKTPPKVAQQHPMHSCTSCTLGAPAVQHSVQVPAFLRRQNSGPPSTSFTIGPRFAEIRA
jgi:hypothetical protein